MLCPAAAGSAAVPLWLPSLGTALYALPVPIAARTARAAFTRQIGRAMTRDTQVLITLIFPIIVPILSSIGPLVSGADRGIAITMSVIIAGTAGSRMIIHGLTRLQFGGGALAQAIAVAAIAPAGMLVKMALFGRMTSGSAKVVVDEVRPEAGFWKWTAVVGLLVVLTAAAILGQRVLVARFGGMGNAIFLVGASRSIFSLGSPRVTRPGGGLDP
jgi:hypothetical protein